MCDKTNRYVLVCFLRSYIFHISAKQRDRIDTVNSWDNASDAQNAVFDRHLAQIDPDSSVFNSSVHILL